MRPRVVSSPVGHCLSSRRLDQEHFWLGNVPCRTVRLVGMIVGLQVYEKKIIYTGASQKVLILRDSLKHEPVDDGTGLVDCVHKITPPSPMKKSPYTPVPVALSLGPPLPKPIAGIGVHLQITGRAMARRDTRLIIVQSIGGSHCLYSLSILTFQTDRCSSPNDELEHWQTVLALHANAYSPDRPFALPVTEMPNTSPPKSPSKSQTPVHLLIHCSMKPSQHASAPPSSFPNHPNARPHGQNLHPLSSKFHE